MDPFLDFFGLGIKDAAKKELEQGSEKGYNRSTGEINRGFGERIIDSVLFRDPERIQQAASDLYEKPIKQSGDFRALGRYSKDPLMSDVDPSIGPTETVAEFKDRVLSTGELLSEKRGAQALGVAPEALSGLSSVSQIAPLIRPAQRKINAEDRDDAFNDPQRRSERERRDKIDQQNVNQLAISNQRLANQEAESARRFDLQQSQLAQDRLNDLELRRDTLGLRQQEQADRMTMFNQKLENDRYNRKKDRMASIMSALGTLGTAFAIT